MLSAILEVYHNVVDKEDPKNDEYWMMNVDYSERPWLRIYKNCPLNDNPDYRLNIERIPKPCKVGQIDHR